jgi:hypothetical protein
MTWNLIRYGIFYVGLTLTIVATGVLSPNDFPTLTLAARGQPPTSITAALELGLECFALALVLLTASAVVSVALGMYLIARYRIFPDSMRYLARTVTAALTGVSTAEQRQLEKLARRIKASAPPPRRRMVSTISAAVTSLHLAWFSDRGYTSGMPGSFSKTRRLHDTGSLLPRALHLRRGMGDSDGEQNCARRRSDGNTAMTPPSDRKRVLTAIG